MRSPTAALAAALLAAAWPSPVPAQSDYPAHTVTMVVPFPPGGVADITARPLAEVMGRFLKQAVIVENRSGAGGGVGMQYVARARPDGYTVLLALSSISIIPEADKVLGRDPMFQLNQLVPIARFTADPTVLAVRAGAVCGFAAGLSDGLSDLATAGASVGLLFEAGIQPMSVAMPTAEKMITATPAITRSGCGVLSSCVSMPSSF